jgi:hydroxyacylglutathione hydrolase
MPLEDHLGDVIRKARGMSGVSMPAAAAAAGIAPAELAAAEESGQFAQTPNLTALGQLLGLDGEKLAGLARGWLPAPVELGTWRQLRQFSSADDSLSVNCYLFWDEATRVAALVDTGLDAKPVLDCIMVQQLTLAHIFITHSHYDHVERLGEIRAAQPEAKLHVGSRHAPPAQRNQPREVISVGNLSVAYRETPGHAADGVTYVVTGWPNDVPAVALVGDAIFAGSMGRGNDSWELARRKVREEILSLPPKTLIGPGHGPWTTVAEELAHNPFF